MKCTNPRKVKPWQYDAARDGPNGTSPTILVDCGKCLACRVNKAREWTIRLTHEANFSQTQPIFITLTYDEEHLPTLGVRKEDVQDFISDLRKVCGSGIRYFIGSEYGEAEASTHRPHYHGLLFNVPTWIWQSPCAGASRVIQIRGKANSISYGSTALNDIWKRGFVVVGAFHPRRAGYLAHYYVDKACAPEGMSPNFSLMSTRPGIGSQYALDDLNKLSSGFPILSHTGSRLALPRYYKRLAIREGVVPEFEPTQENLDRIKEGKITRYDLQETLETVYEKQISWNKSRRQI